MQSIFSPDVLEWVAVVLAILGNLLVAYKQRAGFALWVVANAITIPIMATRGLFGYTVLYLVFLLLAVFSLWKWRSPH